MSADSVITVVRSLVISKKPPCLITDVLRDYREIEGGPLPFQKFGYGNAEEFLASSNAFILDRYGGNTYVTAKTTAESAHIQSMVRLQKATKQKKAKTSARFPNKSNQNWNRTSYSSVYGQNNSNNYRPSTNRPTYNNRQPLRPAGDRNNNNNFQNFQKKSQSQPQQNRPNMVRSSSSSDGNNFLTDNWRTPVKENNSSNNYANSNGKSTGTFSMPEDMRTRLAANKPQPEKKEEPAKTQADDLRNKLNASRSNKDDDLRSRLISNMNNAMQSNTNVPKPQSVVKHEQVPRIVDLTKDLTNQMRIQPQTNQQKDQQQKLSIANRLSLNRYVSNTPPVNRSSSSGSLTSETNITVIKDNKQYQQKPQPKSQQPEKPFKFDKELSPIIQLQDYCRVRQLAPPQYNALSYQGQHKCNLTVNNRTYVSDEFRSDKEAKLACTLEAIEEIKAKESIPPCTDKNYEIKIHERLLLKSGGVFAKLFPHWFETTFEQRVPNDWYQNLQKRPDLFSIENSNSDSLIFAKDPTVSSASSTASSDMGYFSAERMQLPFENKYWNLYVTHCKSTVEVWGRLVGEGFSDKYENLLNDIEVHMLTKARRPQSISCGQIYLSSISDCWHRIRVEERKKDQFLCFYIDFGDEEWVDSDKIYVCEKEFLALPAQGLVFSLFGLEDFSGNRCAERILNKELPNRSLVAEVLTKKEVYEQSFDENSTCGEYKIQVVLYDTSSNDDINLNENLGKQICDETPPPVLKTDGLTTNVNVTHIDQSGNLYIQIRNSDWTYVEKLINVLVESKQINQHKIRKNEISMAGMYLVRSARNGPWIRAVLNSPPDGESDIYDMFYVDYGSTAKIHITDIFRLDSLSAALAKYPSQAVQVKLANIQVSPVILEKIKALLPKNTSAIVKVFKNAIVQEVLLYARMDNGTMFNVNESILIEMYIERDLENGSANQQTRKPFKTASPNQMNYVSGDQRLPDLQNYKIPELNEYMDVLVSMSSNPLNFTVLPYEDNARLDKLMQDMKEHYSSTDEYIPADVIEEGEAYACKHNNFYQRWFLF
ncbi:TDRD7 family protein [Megaselia abdita]